MTEDWMLIKESEEDWIDYSEDLITDEEEQFVREEEWISFQDWEGIIDEICHTVIQPDVPIVAICLHCGNSIASCTC